MIPFVTLGLVESGGFLTAARLLATLDKIAATGQSGIVEVMLHPGRRDEETQRKYGHWGYNWENDLALLLDPDLPEELANRGHEVTSFRELALSHQSHGR